MTVTAQDFYDAIEVEQIYDSYCVDYKKHIVKFDAILSRARQEAVAEELKNKRSELSRIAESLELMLMTKSGYPGHTEAVNMVLGENQRLKYLAQEELVKRARREALKEMDEAHECFKSDIEKLRAEYRNA